MLATYSGRSSLCGFSLQYLVSLRFLCLKPKGVHQLKPCLDLEGWETQKCLRNQQNPVPQSRPQMSISMKKNSFSFESTSRGD